MSNQTRIIIRFEETKDSNGVVSKTPVTCSRKEYKHRYGQRALSSHPQEEQFQELKKQDKYSKLFNSQGPQLLRIQRILVTKVPVYVFDEKEKTHKKVGTRELQQPFIREIKHYRTQA